MNLQQEAHLKVKKAIKYGLLARLDGSVLCVDCSALATEYDHRDYNRPLEVDPVCRPCNFRRGQATDWSPTDRYKAPRQVLPDGTKRVEWHCGACDRSHQVIASQSLRDLRDLAGFSLADVAKLAGCSRSHLCHVEHGRKPPSPTIEKAYMKLAGARRAKAKAPAEDGE